MSMENNLYWYKATVMRVLDGDTAELRLDRGFNDFKETTCRFYGINTPETRTKDAAEKKKGTLAKEFTKSYLSKGTTVIVKSKELDKYGRPLVDIYCGENYSVHLNALLIEKGLATVNNYK